MAALTSELLEHFRANTIWEEDTRCWIWTGSQHDHGYGQCNKNGFGTRLAHRLSWLMHKGPIPKGMVLCHKCDVPACVNPDHLFIGTQYENIQDMIRKGRQGKFETKIHCIKGHEFTKENSIIGSGGYKRCRRCHIDAVLRHKARNLVHVRRYQREHAREKRRAQKCQ